ncbi:MAG: hypothetical protein ACFFCS_23305 [Candidatus Hodarchaeota archaeon]
MPKILIIDKDTNNWFKIFKKVDVTSDIPIEIDQAEPKSIMVIASSKKGISFDLSPSSRPIPNSPQTEYRVFQPDLVLFRRVNKKILYALQFLNVPCINSLTSILANLERPIVYGGLLKVQGILVKENFPLIEQNYYPNTLAISRVSSFPVVMKVGAAHAGFGKMKIDDHRHLEDFTSITALYDDYVTSEPFYSAKYDIRIQKIGDDYRAFRRKIVASWKANVSGTRPELIQVTDKYKSWVDECSKLFGGMDILALDVLQLENGDEIILELNDCQIGFAEEYEEEDMMSVTKLITKKLHAK